MPFDHERLDVYGVALDFVVLADDTIAQPPRGRSHLADQLHRAATSIVLKIARRCHRRRILRRALTPPTPSPASRKRGSKLNYAYPLFREAGEGAGGEGPGGPRRYDLSAAGSATECAAIFDVFQRLRLVPTERHTEAKALLERIASMLIKLAKSLKAPPK